MSEGHSQVAGEETGGGPGTADPVASDPVASEISRPDRPGRFRRLVLRPLLWGLAGIAVAIFLLQLWLDTPKAREQARLYLVEELSAAVDRPVELQEVRFHLLPFHLELWDLSIAGGSLGEASYEQTFLHLPYAYAEVDVDDLRRRRLRLQLLRLERPAIDLRFYPGGGDNMPERNQEKPERPFELWIDQVEIDRAVVGIDHERAEITVDGERLRTRLRGLGDGRLAGRLNAASVRVTLPDSDPMEVAVLASATIESGRLAVSDARVLSRQVDARVTGGCTWDDWEQRSCTFQTVGSGRGGGLRELGYFRSLYGGFTYDGVFAWRPDAAGWRGDVEGDDVLLWGRRVRNIAGRLSGDRFRVTLDVDRARYAGGDLTGRVEVDLTIPGDPVTADLELRNLHLDTLLGDQEIPLEGLAGRVDGRLSYTCELREGLRGTGFAQVEIRRDPGDPGLPVEGSFPLRIADGWVFADSVDVGSDHQSLLANGVYHVEFDRGSFDYDVTTTDVAELLHLLPLEDPPPYLPTAGTGSVVGTLQVQSGFAYNHLEVDLAGVETPQMPPVRVAGRLDVTPWALENLHLDLRSPSRSSEERLVVRGRLPWGSEGHASRLTFDATDWPMEKVHPWLPFDLALDGRVAGGRLELETVGDRQEGVLSASLEPALLAGEVEIAGLLAEMRWEDDRLQVESLVARTPAGVLDALGEVNLDTGEMDLRLSSPGLDVGAAPLAGYLPRQDVRSQLRVEAHLAGTTANPRWNLSLETDRLSLGDREAVDSRARLDAFWEDGRLEVGGQLLDGAEIEGGGTLDEEAVDLAFDLRSDDLESILPYAAPVEGRLGGRLDGRLTITGERGGPLETILGLDRLELDVDDRRLAAVPPVRARFYPEHWTLERLELGEPATGSSVLLEGRLGYELGAPVALDVEADLDGSWIRVALPDLELDGRLGLDGRLEGTLETPMLHGLGTLENGSLELPGVERGFEAMAGTLRFSGDRVSLERLEGNLSGGRALLTGELSWAEEAPVYRLDLTAEDAALSSVEGWSLAGDASLALRSVDGGEGHLLSGTADLDRLAYREDLRFDAARLLRQLLRGRRLDVEAADDQLAAVALQVRLQAPGNVVLRNNVADITGSADLQLRGNLAQPVLFGELTLDPGGRMVYNSTDYRLERGRVVFADPYRLEPEVDLVAVTEIRDFDVTLALSGPVERLEARFSSEPPLPDVEVLRLLAGGDTYVEQAELVPDRGSRLDREDENSAATFLYGQAASAIGDRVGSLFGFDQFRIDPLLTGSGDNLSRARITVGKHLAKDIFVTYSVDPSSSDNQRIRVEWQLTESLVLVLTQNGDNTYSADARWETNF